MKILITAIGSSGDVNPLIAIGLALKARGHDVVMLVNPYFEAQILEVGLDYIPLGDPIDLRQIAEMPELMHPRKALRRTLHYLILPNIPVTIEAVDAAIQDERPDIVLGGHSSHGTRWICERRGVPYAGAVLTPLLWLSRRDPSVFQPWESEDPPAWYLRCRYRVAKWILRFMIDRPFNRIRRDCGFPEERDLYLADVLGGVVNLALWSPSFRGPLSEDPPNGHICGFPWFDRHTAFEHRTDDIDRFLGEGEAPIIFTLGTAAVHIAGSFFEDAIEACRILGRRGALLTRHREYAPRHLPPGVAAFTYVPFSTLLPRGLITVHHGGIGTTAQAMRAGRPTVIVPFSHDQFDNAARAKRLGVSVTLLRKKISPRTLAGALRTVLRNPEFARRAKELGETLSREDGALTAAVALEEVVNGASADASPEELAAAGCHGHACSGARVQSAVLPGRGASPNPSL